MHNSSQYELVDYTLLETQGACDINSNPNDPGGIDIDLNHKPDLTPDQQYQLGLKYYFGEQHEQDYDEAIKWFKLAASNDKVEAQMQLANMYYQKAKIWYTLANVLRERDNKQIDPSHINDVNESTGDLK